MTSISWHTYSPLPLPEDQEGLFVAVWALAGLIGFGIGLRMDRRPWRRLTLAGALFLLCLTALAAFDQRRIFIGGPPGPSVTLVLPLLACPGAAGYWPGGPMRDLAMAEDIRAIREQQSCMASTRLGDGLYLTLSSILVGLAMVLLGGASLTLARQEKALDAVAALFRRWWKP